MAQLSLLPEEPHQRRRAQLAARHRRWARVLAKLGLAALQARDPADIRPGDAVRLLALAAELEREAVRLLEEGWEDIDLSSLSLEELERLARGR